MSREEELERILLQHGIGGILRDSRCAQNPFIGLFEYDGKMLCHLVTNGEVEFHLINDPRRNAVAVYSTNSVGVFVGMLDVIFKLSAKIVDGGLFPHVGNVETTSWNPDIHNTFESRESLLKSIEQFAWSQDRLPWIKSMERQALFMFIANTLFRFIVFHELGHIYNDHGRAKPKPDNFELDEMSTDHGLGNISSQAKESIADTFAFQLLVEYQRSHLEQQKDHPIGALLKEKLFQTDHDLVRFISQLIYVYFYMMETPNWLDTEPGSWSHPPAPFRLQTIYAALLEHSILSLTQKVIPDLLRQSIFLGSSTLAVIFNRYPDFNWLSILDQKKYRDHYKNIYMEMDNWVSDEKRWNK